MRAIGDTGGAARRGAAITRQRGKPKPKSKRKIYLGKGYCDIPVFEGAALGAGAKLAGPAVIEQPTTTILLLDGQDATVDACGNLLVEMK